MRISADHELARSDETLFGEKCMLDAHAPAIVKVTDLHLGGESAYEGAVARSLNVLVRREMIHNQHDLLRIENRVETVLFHFLDRDGCSDVASHHEIEFRVDEIPCGDAAFSAVCGKDLLGDCHAHGCYLRPPARCSRRAFPCGRADAAAGV